MQKTIDYWLEEAIRSKKSLIIFLKRRTFHILYFWAILQWIKMIKTIYVRQKNEHPFVLFRNRGNS